MPATNNRPISILLFNNLETIDSMIRRLLRTTYKYIIPPLLLSKFLLAFRLILILIVRVLINDEFLQPLHLIPHLSHQVILPLQVILHFVHLSLIYSLLIIQLLLIESTELNHLANGHLLHALYIVFYELSIVPRELCEHFEGVGELCLSFSNSLLLVSVLRYFLLEVDYQLLHVYHNVELLLNSNITAIVQIYNQKRHKSSIKHTKIYFYISQPFLHCNIHQLQNLYSYQINPYMKREIKLLIILLLLAAFILPCETQRGRSSSSRRSSRMSSHSKKSEDCFRADGKPCKPKESQALFAFTIWLCLAIPLIICGCICEAKKEDDRNESIQTTFFQFRQQLDKNESSLSKDEKDKLIQKLQKTQYLMQIYSFDRQQQINCYLKLSKIASLKEDVYSVTFDASDEVGRSSFQGILSFKKQWMCFKLSKTYMNRKKARQINSFSVILYDGMGNADSMQGNWLFKGYQKSQRYAGYWTMYQQ